MFCIGAEYNQYHKFTVLLFDEKPFVECERARVPQSNQSHLSLPPYCTLTAQLPTVRKGITAHRRPLDIVT